MGVGRRIARAAVFVYYYNKASSQSLERDKILCQAPPTDQPTNTYCSWLWQVECMHGIAYYCSIPLLDGQTSGGELRKGKGERGKK